MKPRNRAAASSIQHPASPYASSQYPRARNSGGVGGCEFVQTKLDRTGQGRKEAERADRNPAKRGSSRPNRIIPTEPAWQLLSMAL
ncbi:GD19164 [Drosophila simulans]|uniref:GD19164 n=1 Tax=Drosophila simulans TaxID=7240 RepID=B4QVP8_DROSI|nr:GD19164 [Drosophila simulans]